MSRAKLIYINIDGFSYSYLDLLRRMGRSAELDELISEALLLENLSSGLISITNPMQGAILAGAWSDRTQNIYQHYDPDSGEVVKHRRTLAAENVGQLFHRHGDTVVSIHQFMLAGNPCEYGDKNATYVTVPRQPSNAFDRLQLLEDLLRRNTVLSGETSITYPELPDFIAVYIDDIDSLGHNNDYENYPRRRLFAERQLDIAERLQLILRRILELYRLSRSGKDGARIIWLITTDHGMTPFYGKSSLPLLIKELDAAGLTCRLPEERCAGTLLVALPYTIELALYPTRALTAEESRRIMAICAAQPYVRKVFTRQEMLTEYHMDPRGPEFLLCPTYGEHFYKRDAEPGFFAASHDSCDATSQHIFGLLLGDQVRKGTFQAPVSAIDLMPTILKHAFDYTLSDSVGKVFEGFFC